MMPRSSTPTLSDLVSPRKRSRRLADVDGDQVSSRKNSKSNKNSSENSGQNKWTNVILNSNNRTNNRDFRRSDSNSSDSISLSGASWSSETTPPDGRKNCSTKRLTCSKPLFSSPPPPPTTISDAAAARHLAAAFINNNQTTSIITTTEPSPFYQVTSCLPMSVNLPRLGINAAALPSICTTSGSLETPPVLHGNKTPLLRVAVAQSIADDQTPNTAANSIGVITGQNSMATGGISSWPIQDFDNIPIGFDGSLSGLSDLNNTSGYMNDMLELVKRQSMQATSSSSMQAAPSNSENYFQFILMAPTSSAVKITEEPLTYLNQSQSYEIKCKKLNSNEISCLNRLYKTIVRVGFHDRRQKFQEKELLHQWKQMHNCSKIIDADVPLSLNVFNVKTDVSSCHVEFTWDSAKNTSVFIKVNCISTEFTVHKHGGEKGVPFRLQVDTYTYNEGTPCLAEPKQLHSAYCQIKVFKTKGADRKIKTDKERAEKRADKEKYQPSYDTTVLIETFPTNDSTFEYDNNNLASNFSPQCVKLEGLALNLSQSNINSNTTTTINNNNGATVNVTTSDSAGNVCLSNGNVNDGDSAESSQAGTNSPSPSNDEICVFDALLAETTPNETADWLRRQRFNHFMKAFFNFSGTDLLRLSRDDTIRICGVPDGIRLFNALQYKRLEPKLTLYMCIPGAPAYHAVFLKALTLTELVRKVCDLIQVQSSQIYDVYCQGPDGINVHVNDEVVQNLVDKSRFIIDAMKCGEESDSFRILLKSAGDCS